ncbi:MAG: PKD domain-containing protein [Chitinophagales bacterium]
MIGKRLPVLSAILVIGFLIGCTKTTPDQTQPQQPPRTKGTIPPNNLVHPFLNLNAAFTYSAILNDFHAPAGFDFTSSTSQADSIWWDFGDGTGTFNTINPSHIFANPGNYLVILKAKFGPRTTADTERITVLNALYTKFTIDSIRSDVITSNRPDTVFFSIVDSAHEWESEIFPFPALPQGSSVTSRITQSFLFQHPDTISNFGNSFSIAVRDNYMRPPYGPPASRGRGSSPVSAGHPYSNIIFDNVSPFSLVGYPSVLQNQDLTIGSGMEFTVYISWK